MSKATGGDAFPHQATAHRGASAGMTLRDWFAGMAISSLVNPGTLIDTKQVAEDAYAMIAGRA